MAGLLDLEEERRKNLAPTNPRSIAGLLGTVGENPNARMMIMAQDYARNLPQQLATNQAAMDKAIGGWNKTDFATGQANPNYYPEAVQELTQIMPNIGALTAWHGTPHNIMGKFDISKVGTGEGAQAYGHGMYFAENPSVADQYRKDLSAIVNYDQSTKKYQVLDKSRKVLGEYEDMLKAGQEADKAGNLYKVDIPDKDIPNMLDWDKPLSQQSKSVQKALAKHDPEMFGKKGGDYDANELGQSVYQRLSARDVTNNGYGGNSKRASDLLNSLGIKGIRYNDAGSRGATGGTSNFVVFDPSTVKILEKNKKKVGLLD